MSKTSNPTIVTCDTSALSRAASAILTRTGRLTKNAILNDISAAIAGPGRDWGFLRNRPDGRFVQPGLTPDAAAVDASATTPSGVAPVSLWVVSYDEEAAWAPSAARLFTTREAALEAVRADHAWWQHPDHPPETVMNVLAENGIYTFGASDDADEDEVVDAYRITLSCVQVEGGLTAPASSPEEASADELLILVSPHVPYAGTHGLEDFVLFANEAAFLAWCGRLGLEPELGDPPMPAEDYGFRATFRPEVWIRDHAVPVDPQGETEWEVEIDELDPEAGDCDYLKDSRHAPAWVRDWTGPFTLTLTAEERDDL